MPPIQNIMLVLNKFFGAIQLVIVYDLYLSCNLDFSTVARFLILKCKKKKKRQTDSNSRSVVLTTEL